MTHHCTGDRATIDCGASSAFSLTGVRRRPWLPIRSYIERGGEAVLSAERVRFYSPANRFLATSRGLIASAFCFLAESCSRGNFAFPRKYVK